MLFDSLFNALIPGLAELYLWLASFVFGNFVVYGKHWGKLAWDDKFQSPGVVFLWLLIGVVTALIATNLLTPVVTAFLYSYSDSTVAIFCLVVGSLYVWFFVSNEFGFRDGKWKPPVILYSIAILNLILVYGPSFLGIP